MAGSGEVTLVGNLTADPKLLAWEDGGVSLDARFAVAWRTKERTKDGNGAWVDDEDATGFYSIRGIKGQYAHNAAASLRKGMPVMVTGRICPRKWTSTDKNTGQPTSGISLEIHATSIAVPLHFGTVVYTKTAPAEVQPQVVQAPQVGAPESNFGWDY